MLLHQGIGLDVFNALPTRKAVHALYECCNSVPLAADLARCRPFADHDALFRQAGHAAVRPRRVDPSTRSCRPTLISAGAPAARSRGPSSARCGLINPR